MEILIKQFIETFIPDLSGRLYPVFSEDVNNLSIKYVITPVSGGHVRQSQMELVIISPDYDECMEIREMIVDLMDMEPDRQPERFGNLMFHSELSGGGLLFNDVYQMYEDTLYFIIDWRLL